MALTLPYSSIDQFAADTVHSDTAHNTPHNRLIANDLAIKTYVDALVGVTAILYTQTAALTTSLNLTTAGTWIVRCDAFHFSNIVSAFTLTMDGTIVQTLQSLGDIPGANYNNMFGYVTKVIASPYSFVCTISTDGSVYANTGRIGIIAFKIG